VTSWRIKTRTGQTKDIAKDTQKLQLVVTSDVPQFDTSLRPLMSKKVGISNIVAVNGNSSDDGLDKGPWSEPSLGGGFAEQSSSKV
jgi:hypothetical protein